MTAATAFEPGSQGNRFLGQLEERRSRLGVETPRCLLVACEEEVGLVGSPYESRFADALAVATAGASVEDPELIEALRHAVEELGVERVVLMAHSLCEHVAEELGLPRSGAVRGSGTSFGDWLEARVQRVNGQMEGAREGVRRGVRWLEEELSDLDVQVLGCVRAVESDVYHVYRPAGDVFEAMR